MQKFTDNRRISSYYIKKTHTHTHTQMSYTINNEIIAIYEILYPKTREAAKMQRHRIRSQMK